MTEEPSVGVVIDRVSHITCVQCGTQMDVSALEPFAIAQCPSCGDQDAVPGRFGGFLLLNLINVGGMGAVYRARDESLGRLVAIKVMLGKLGEDVEFVENFKREAQAAARLNHPNVAQIYSYGQSKGQPYIVMELVSGHRFDRLIESHPDGLDPGLVLRVAMDIAEGLKAADEIGLIHGDIKPENILLDEKRKAKLVDFGIASFVDQAASEGIWGSPYYIAPEKARGRKSDARSDIYSLGATLYHALAGKPPFDGETPMDVVKARLTGDPVPLGEARPDLSKVIVDCVARMLQREPAQRHPTYASLLGDFRRGLEAVASMGGPSLRTGGPGRRVVLKKKEGSPALTASQSGQVSGRHRAALRAGLPLVPSVEERLAAEQAVRHGRHKKVAMVGVVLVLVLAVVGFGISRYQARQREFDQRRQALALQHSIEAVLTVFTGIDTGATNVVRLAARLEPLVVRLQDAERDVATLVGVPAAPPAGGQPPAPAAEPEGQAPAAAPAAGGVKLDEAGREAPFGASAVPAPRVADPAGVAEATPVPPLAVAAPEDPLMGTLTAIREARSKIETLQQDAGTAVERTTRALRTGTLMRTGLLEAKNADEVSRKERELREQLAEVNRQEKAVAAIVEEAESLAAGASAQVAAARTLSAQRQAEAEARRLASERAEQAGAEQAKVDELAVTVRDMIRTWRYAEAKALAMSVKESLTLDAARAGADAVGERVKRIDDLRRFIARELKREPFPWGWGRVGGTREDVLGADEAKGIVLRSRVVPWEQVGVAQYVTIVDHCLSRSSVRRSEQGKQTLALALFCSEHGGADAARRYAEKAVSISPTLERDVEQLLP